MAEIAEIPYFLENKNWYYYDEKEGCYKLTDQATPEAKKSFEEFYKEDDLYIITRK